MQQSTSTKRRFIIDTDAGCDDAGNLRLDCYIFFLIFLFSSLHSLDSLNLVLVAILLLLSKIQKGEPFEVVAFTAVQGTRNDISIR